MAEIVLPQYNPAFGLTLQEIIDQVSDEVRDKTINSRIVRWVNMSVLEISSHYQLGHLHMYGTKNTTVGMPDVTLDENFHWLKTLQIAADQRKIYPEDEQRLSEQYPDYRTRQGTIERYYLNGNVLGLFQVPSGTKVLSYSYQRRPNKMDLTLDINNYPDLPPEWHSYVAQKATTLGYRYKSDSEGIANSEREENRILVRLSRSIYRRPDETMVLSSPVTGRGIRPPRPRLPSNFPSG